jgi:hypothetical protein
VTYGAEKENVDRGVRWEQDLPERYSVMKEWLGVVACSQIQVPVAANLFAENVLFGGYKRVGNRVNRQRDAILYTHLAHELGNVRFHSSLFDSQRCADFLVGTPGYEHL